MRQRQRQLCLHGSSKLQGASGFQRRRVRIRCDTDTCRKHKHTSDIVCLPFKTRDGDGQTARARRRGGVKDDTGDNRGVAAALGVIHSADVNDRQTGTWFSSPKNDERHPEMSMLAAGRKTACVACKLDFAATKRLHRRLLQSCS